MSTRIQEKIEKRNSLVKKIADIFIEEKLTTKEVKNICGILMTNCDFKEAKQEPPIFELISHDSWGAWHKKKEEQ